MNVNGLEHITASKLFLAMRYILRYAVIICKATKTIGASHHNRVILCGSEKVAIKGHHGTDSIGVCCERVNYFLQPHIHTTHHTGAKPTKH